MTTERGDAGSLARKVKRKTARLSRAAGVEGTCVARHATTLRVRAAFFVEAVLAVVALIAIGSVSSTSLAESKTSFLAEQLRKHTDFRVRTAAALKLGASDDAAAVKPLCACLGDESEVEAVQIACAAALGKLRKAGCDTCLKAQSSHGNAKVREQVNASLTALGNATASGGGGGAPVCPAPANAKPKYYVGVEVLNKSTRSDAEVRPLVEREVMCRLVALGRFKVVAGDEAKPANMATALKSEKLEGVLLSVAIDPIKYDGGNLKVSLSLVVQTHTRDIKATLGKSLTMPGVSAASKSEENDLLKIAAEKLVNDFATLKP